MDPTPTLMVPLRIPAPDVASCSEANFSEGQIQESPDQLESLDASIAWQQLPRVIGETRDTTQALRTRSEEHTSELQSRLHLVCRLLLEKKKKKNSNCRSLEVRKCYS